MTINSLRSILQPLYIYLKNQTQTIRAKVVLTIAMIFILSFSATTLYVSHIAQVQTLNNIKNQSFSVANKILGEIKVEFNKAITSTNTISNYFAKSTYLAENQNADRNKATTLLRTTIENTPDFSSIYTVWEQNAFDNNDLAYRNVHPYDNTGRYALYYNKDIYGGILTKPLVNFENSDSYNEVKSTKQPFISNPYVEGINGKQKILTTISSPILIKNNFAGIVAIDMQLNFIQKILKQNAFYDENVEVRIIANDLTIVVDMLNAQNNGHHYSEICATPAKKQMEIEQKSITTIDNPDYYSISMPLVFDKYNAPWQMEIIISKINNANFATNYGHILTYKIVFLFVIFIISLLGIANYIRKLIKPLGDISKVLDDVAKGKLRYKKIKSTGLEIDNINNALNLMLNSIGDKVKILKSISKGDLSNKIETPNSEDELSQSINLVIESLNEAKNENIRRKKEDENRNWSSEGLAFFANLLRDYSDDMQQFSKVLIKNIVNYMDVNQGGIYLINNKASNPVIETAATYAYDNLKNKIKTYQMNEGLIGRCVEGKEVIYLTDLPDSYISISSGLGKIKPDTIYLVPLQTATAVLGAIEVASFGTIEQHKRAFLLKLSENIAITIQNVRFNENTKELLASTKAQAEMLAQQEEEMRQNFEELNAAQEQSDKREAEAHSLFAAINSNSLVVEYDLKGNIIEINDRFVELLEIDREDIMRKTHRNLDSLSKSDFEYQQLWNKLQAGEVIQKKTNIELPFKQIWLNETYTPIYDASGDVERIFVIASDITNDISIQEILKLQADELKIKEEEINSNISEMHEMVKKLSNKEIEMRGQLSAINDVEAMAEYDTSGYIIKGNTIFCKQYGYSKRELAGLHISKLMGEDQNLKSFKHKWRNIIQGHSLSGEMKRYDKNGAELIVKGTLSPIADREGKTVKIMELSIDISSYKIG